MERKYQPGIVVIDAGYGNNTSLLLALENRQLKYLGGLTKNRKITINQSENILQTISLDELAQSLPQQAFTKIKLNLDEPRTVWVVTTKIEISNIEGKRNIAIVMNAATFSEATDIDYFITNVSTSIIKKLASEASHPLGKLSLSLSSALSAPLRFVKVASPQKPTSPPYPSHYQTAS